MLAREKGKKEEERVLSRESRKWGKNLPLLKRKEGE